MCVCVCEKEREREREKGKREGKESKEGYRGSKMDEIDNDFVEYFMNATDHLSILLKDLRTHNGSEEQELVDSLVKNFGDTVGSLGLTSIIVISVACVLAFAGGCYCALKRTKRKASKVGES